MGARTSYVGFLQGAVATRRSQQVSNEGAGPASRVVA